ncbi:GGDEF domain-containing protein [Vibrio sp. 10N.239.312.C11]
MTLKTLMNLDPLSQLFNRLTLAESITQWRDTVEIEQPYALLLIDIDYYKQFNDCYGHVKGDEVLVTISKQLKHHFSAESFKVFRFGGDEFLVLCTGETKNALLAKTSQLLSGVHDLNISHKKSKCSDRLTLSVGGAIFTHFDILNLTNEELIQKTDKTLYKVKDQGRNGILIED